FALQRSGSSPEPFNCRSVNMPPISSGPPLLPQSGVQGNRVLYKQIQSARAAGVAIRGPREPLGEDASPTLRDGTEEAARLDSQPDRRAVPRQVSQGAAIAAMDPARQLAAVRTRDDFAPRAQLDRDPMRTRSHGDQLQLPRSRKERKRHRVLPGPKTTPPGVPPTAGPDSQNLRENRFSTAVDIKR